jgi:two-component system, chemotaxis family, chemotaxis protein CheY
MLGQSGILAADDTGLVATHDARPAPRILVIDDDKLHRMIICRVAAKAGYIPIGGASYEEASELAQETAFDCITLDLSLGEHAGVDMLRRLRGIGCRSPIIIISGCDDASCRETVRVAKSLNLNVLDPLPKPVDIAMLRDALQRLRLESILAVAS